MLERKDLRIKLGMTALTASPILEFVRSKLNEPDVSLNEVARQVGVARNTVLFLKKGVTGNNGPGVKTVEAVARHFGYRFDPAPISERRANVNAGLRKAIEQAPSTKKPALIKAARATARAA